MKYTVTIETRGNKNNFEYDIKPSRGKKNRLDFMALIEGDSQIKAVTISVLDDHKSASYRWTANMQVAPPKINEVIKMFAKLDRLVRPKVPAISK